MTTKVKSTVEPKSHLSNDEEVQATDTSTSYTHWMRQVLETMLKSEQKWLEMATEQNELSMKALKQGTEMARTVPFPPITEWARRSEERFIEAQRRWIDTTTHQRDRVLSDLEKAEKQAEGTPTPNFKTVTGLVREQVEGLIEARNRWLDFVAKQNELFIQGIEETLGVKEASPADKRAKLVEETVDNYIEVQKRLLKNLNPATQTDGHKKTHTHHNAEPEAQQKS